MACEGCCRVDQNETTYMPEKATGIKDDQVLLAAPLRQQAPIVVAQAASAPVNAAAASPPPASLPTNANAGDFVGAWEDKDKSVCSIGDTTLRWSNSAISKISVVDGKLMLEDSDATATLDNTKAMLTWSDGDVWNRTVVPAEFGGMWQDPSSGVHTILGYSVKWSNGSISDVMFSGTSLRLRENELTATLDDTKTKVVWSDGDIWTKTDKTASTSEFAGVWKDTEEKVHSITDTTLNWSNTMSSVIKVDGNQLQVDGVTASLDETSSKLVWSDGDTWTRTSSRPV